MKLTFKILLVFIFILLVFIIYSSLIGFETKRFNNQIINKLEKFEKNLEVELNEIKIVLNPFKFKIRAKTVGTKFKRKNKVIEIQSINTEIPIKTLFNKKVLIENLEISTKSLQIKDLINFIRVFNKNPELFFLEKIIKKGFLIADIKINFNQEGHVKDDFKISGIIKDTKINILKKYKISKLDLNFKYEKNLLALKDAKFRFNDQNFYSKNLNLINVKDGRKIEGEIDNSSFELNDENFNLFLKPFFKGLDIEKIKFNSKNKFSFLINNKFQINNFNLISKINLEELLFLNNFKFKKILPEVGEKIKFLSHKIELEYKKKALTINGKGNILLQKNNDELIYSIKNNKNSLDFKTSLIIKRNPLKIKIIDYEKNLDNDLILKVDGTKKLDNKIKFDLISIEEEKNKFDLEALILNEKFKIIDLKKAKINFFDSENNRNKFEIRAKDKEYYITGIFFNANNIIENFIENDDQKLNLFNKNFELNINLNELFLSKDHILKDFKGKLSINDQKIINGNLIGSFSSNKKFKFTVKSNGNEKITTLFLDRAEAIVNRYKFIKGFDEGVLDFYSSKKGDESISTIKIYDFKLKELPVLTKLLTLASLQGIADLLSGEGIRFNEFEMNFSNKKSLMTINEIYAIGPAISILMDGYVEKNKLISLRGTLVPATTINKAIGSIPILGQILVGSKTGEGVFGVSFKIKGPPKKLETSVNPIKTLTPRFITRTLEKIKKN